MEQTLEEQKEQQREQQWRTFELYEKIRVRERRKRFFLISFVLILFLGLCSVPVIQDRMPKWRSLRAAQHISIEIEKLKTLSIHEKKPVRLTFVAGGDLKIEIVETCAADAKVIRSEQKKWESESEELKVLSVEEAKAFDVKLAVDQVCFDPVFGLNEKARKVIIVAPVKDLSLERASYVVLDGESAKISIN